MKMEHTECPEMLGYKIQTPGNYPEESIQAIKYQHFNTKKVQICETLASC
jgi:hypothetical protein